MEDIGDEGAEVVRRRGSQEIRFRAGAADTNQSFSTGRMASPTRLAQAEGLKLLASLSREPSVPGTREKWMTWVIVVKSIFDGAISLASYPG